MPLHFEAEDLIVKYLRNEITEEESIALEEWKQQSPKNREVFEKLTNEAGLTTELNIYRSFDTIAGFNKLKKEIDADEEQAPVTRIPVWKKMIAAASIIFVLGLGSYFLIFNNPAKQDDIAKTELPQDVTAPKGTKATITLANGQKVYLDSANSGMLAQQGNVKVIKLANGQIAYQTESGNVINEIQYNTLSNPRGSKVIDITLADGSRVWLNTGSSLRYPVAFVGNERNVSISGEAYFEIAHDATKPFIVSKGEASVQVLGTHFNINAYDDESNIKVTLLEGSVKINNNVIIKQGQQAQVSGSEIKVQTVDVYAVVAWQRGIFELSQTELPAIMRQISRWYDLDIVYEGTPGNEKFGGGISKNVPLSSMLKLLEANGVKFTLVGRKLIVKPR